VRRGRRGLRNSYYLPECNSKCHILLQVNSFVLNFVLTVNAMEIARRRRMRWTKPRARMWNIRLAHHDRELLFLAAVREQVSQADFVRAALRERAARVLQPSGGAA
jgi:uncharacterized protein (DUF1778 family)